MGMSGRWELIMSSRNLSSATGRTELPITELVEKDKSRFGSENAKSCLGHDKVDVCVWFLNRDAQHVIGYTSLMLWLEITHFGVISIIEYLKPRVCMRLPI